MMLFLVEKSLAHAEIHGSFQAFIYALVLANSILLLLEHRKEAFLPM